MTRGVALTDLHAVRAGSDSSLYLTEVDMRRGKTAGLRLRKRPGGVESVEGVQLGHIEPDDHCEPCLFEGTSQYQRKRLPAHSF
jgi:hypothetical protein